jgi:hypothetical protein
VTVSTEDSETPAPPSMVRIGRLNSLHSVRRELARLYVDLRNERVTPKIAGTSAYILTAITKAMEVELLETRLEALERRAGTLQRPRSGRFIPSGTGNPRIGYG